MSSSMSNGPIHHQVAHFRLTSNPIAATEPPKKHYVYNLPKTGLARNPSTTSKWLFMALPAFLIGIYAANFILDLYRFGDPEIIDRIRASAAGVSHVIGGGTAMLLGPFQFLASIRQHAPKIHRWIGRVYAGGILIGGVNAFYVSFTSLCRPLGQYAFAFLGFIWLVTAMLGMLAIWKGKVSQHQDWMTRNFALTYAAVMLRWQLPLLIGLGMGTEPSLTLTGFTCWIPNLVFAEWWINRHKPFARMTPFAVN